MNQPSHGYSQISTYLRGQFRTLKDPDEHALAQFNTLSTGTTREEFAAASTLPDIVTKFMCQLDTKIDALLAGMQTSALEHDFPYHMEIIAISASGIDFTTEMPLAPNDWLEIVISFRQAGVFTAAGIGNVTKRASTMDSTPVFSFAFTRIQEEEREKIIRYVFREERRQLRETRLEQDT